MAPEGCDCMFYYTHLLCNRTILSVSFKIYSMVLHDTLEVSPIKKGKTLVFAKTGQMKVQSLAYTSFGFGKRNAAGLLLVNFGF